MAETTCCSVIIERGTILRAGTLQEILSRSGKAHRTVVLRPLNRPEELARVLLETPGVEDARAADGVVEADISDDDEACCDLLETVVRAGFRLLEYRPRRADLEQIFLDVTRGDVQ